ncbi:hypothetical protein H9L39_01879 [Fusarium oxysporum f. sp. albedinis]|nr:hypothetical protein H9L39_01879 [Fusarium oxysporum f. sp. albedinis]
MQHHHQASQSLVQGYLPNLGQGQPHPYQHRMMLSEQKLSATQPIRGNYPTTLARHLVQHSLMAKELFDWSSDVLSQETLTTLVALNSLGRPAIGCHHRYPALSLFNNCPRHTHHTA